MYTIHDINSIFNYYTDDLYHDLYYMAMEDNPRLDEYSLAFSYRETSLILNLFGCIDNA